MVLRCNDLAESSVRIIDAIEIPDKLTGSVLGLKNGQVYKNLIDTITTRKKY